MLDLRNLVCYNLIIPDKGGKVNPLSLPKRFTTLLSPVSGLAPIVSPNENTIRI